jgi:hypothetical protein
VVRLDVLLEELARRRFFVDVELGDVDALGVQKTSGVLARRSGGLPVESRFRHHCRIIEIADGRVEISGCRLDAL